MGIVSEESKIPDHFPFLHNEIILLMEFFVCVFSQDKSHVLFKFIKYFAKSKKILFFQFFSSPIDNGRKM